MRITSKYTVKEGYILLLDWARTILNRLIGVTVDHQVFIRILLISKKRSGKCQLDRGVSVNFFYAPTHYDERTK